MKYRVVWDDWEDGRTGIDWYVEADNLGEAYCKAIDELSDYAKKFLGCDLEALVDENGEYYWPEFFLKDSEVIKAIENYGPKNKPEDKSQEKQ